jgi:hypothetical protein
LALPAGQQHDLQLLDMEIVFGRCPDCRAITGSAET